ncbi:hypothetical protein CRYUN_Cryun23aG0165900 [Craigia yunnanensis]
MASFRQYLAHIRGLNAYDRHKKFLNDYITSYFEFVISRRIITSDFPEIGLRWRTEKEVIPGKGQFICGNKHCNEKDDLASYEASVNFSYFEAGENKQSPCEVGNLSKVKCAEKLHYKKRKEELDRKLKNKYKRKRDQSKDKDDTNEECEMSKVKRKGKGASSSAVNHESDDDDKGLDKYLEGMFP